jgi:hypothetical protein
MPPSEVSSETLERETTPVLKIDPGASTALALVGAAVKLAHAARSRSRARTCAGV